MICFDRVSKAYRVHPQPTGNSLARIVRRARALLRPQYHEVLRNITLRVDEGETVALLGQNGCGKTTLLRLACGITRPTSGVVKVKGRAGGLIELTAGFHEELTGLENIFLNGTLLGLPQMVIRKRLDAILDFAELGDFIHTPVKHYSWGMLLRLGFAIAVHADLDILVVDEALAVGDGYFQWKCLQRVEEWKREGKTLLFVSHVPAQAESVCDRAIWLLDGKIRADGRASEVCRLYSEYVMERITGGTPTELPLDLVAFIPSLRFGTGYALIRDVRVTDESGMTRHLFKTGEPAIIEMRLEVARPIDDLTIVYQFDQANRAVVKTATHHWLGPFELNPGRYTVRIRLPELRLYNGTYYLTIGLRTVEKMTVHDAMVHMFTFGVKSGLERFSPRVYDTGAYVEWMPDGTTVALQPETDRKP